MDEYEKRLREATEKLLTTWVDYSKDPHSRAFGEREEVQKEWDEALNDLIFQVACTAAEKMLKIQQERG